MKIEQRFIADDGREFKSGRECVKYEKYLANYEKLDKLFFDSTPNNMQWRDFFESQEYNDAFLPKAAAAFNMTVNELFNTDFYSNWNNDRYMET